MSDARSTLYQDLFGLDGLLTEEEREVRERVRAFSDAEVIPIMADCWERGEFPFQLVPKLAALSICGGHHKGIRVRGSQRGRSGARGHGTGAGRREHLHVLRGDFRLRNKHYLQPRQRGSEREVDSRHGPAGEARGLRPYRTGARIRCSDDRPSTKVR